MMNKIKQYWWIIALGAIGILLLVTGRSGASSRAWAQAVSLWHMARRDRAEVELSKLDSAESKVIEQVERATHKAAEHEQKAIEALERADLPAEELKRKIDELYK